MPFHKMTEMEGLAEFKIRLTTSLVVIHGRISSEMTSGGVVLALVTDGDGNKLGCSNLAADHKS